jgi:hypothetical protein
MKKLQKFVLNKERKVAGNRLPWTREQIDELIPKVKQNLAEQEANDPELRPLPPMTVEECKEYFFCLVDIASTRALNENEAGILGQLLSVFQFAVRAETLGKKGRFFVISEDDISKMIQNEN